MTYNPDRSGLITHFKTVSKTLPMDEMKIYDNAAHTFYSMFRLKGLPLISWDLYGSYFDNLCKKYEDIIALGRLAKHSEWSYRSTFDEALLHKEQVIIVTDPALRIVHATHNIFVMNGYLPKDVLGKKPKMFQGPKTSKKTSKIIRSAIENRTSFEATILNYRKNGSTYNCWIKGEPIFDKKGNLIHFIAYEKSVA